MSNSAVSVKDLSFGYPNLPNLIRFLSFEVKEGDIFAILGVNGCGKSTLIDILLGQKKPSSGTVEMQERCGFVPQKFSTSFDYSVEDIVLMGRATHVKTFSVPTEHDRQVAENALNALGIAHWRHRIFSELSGGQQQLVLLSRALATESKTILLDEPTSALVLGNQNKVLSLLKDIAERTGLTVIFTTHQPNHTVAIANKVLLMNKPNYPSGPIEEVLTPETLTELFGMKIINMPLTVGNKTVDNFVPVFDVFQS